MSKINSKKEKGYIALISVLVVSGVALMILMSAGFLSVLDLKMELQKSQSNQAYYLANLCAEHSLMQLKENISYNGNESLGFKEGTCQILPIEGSWTIKILASSSQQVKKMKIITSQIIPRIIIDSWEEVADF